MKPITWAEDEGFACIFARGKNKDSHQFLNWWQQHATGMLRFNLSNPYPNARNSPTTLWSGFFWQRMRDSNPRKRSQSPVCYRYTNPLCDRHVTYYTDFARNVKNYFPIYRKYFPGQELSCPGYCLLFTRLQNQEALGRQSGRFFINARIANGEQHIVLAVQRKAFGIQPGIYCQ